MGSVSSKILKPRRTAINLGATPTLESKITPSFIGPIFDNGFLQPYKDPKAEDDSLSFPLDGLELSSVSDQELARMFKAAPKLYDYDGVSVARLSKTLAIKGGEDVAATESHNMVFASETLHLPVPQVHRTFTADVPGRLGGRLVKGHFIVMDYVQGPTVEECWHSLDPARQQSVVDAVAAMVETMQKTPLDFPPGPIGGTQDRKFEGPWFTEDGAGPFTTLQELEDWCNHKVDICIQFKQLPKRAPRFKFRSVVLTHQDIAPRNLILDAQGKVWLVDWATAGAYPPGFEQAVLSRSDFGDMVLPRLSDRQEHLAKQFAMIAYGLSVAARL